MLGFMGRRLVPGVAVCALAGLGASESKSEAMNGMVIRSETHHRQQGMLTQQKPLMFQQREREQMRIDALKPPDFSGAWLLNLERSQHDELIAIMSKIGVPGYMIRLGRWSRSHMEVKQTEDNVLVEERITQAGGLYKNTVQLFTDEREFVAKHPLDGSRIITKTRWEAIPLSELQPCSRKEPMVMCCVSRATYEKYGHQQRIIRFLDDDGKTFHSINSLFINPEEPPITAHRFLDRVD